MQKWTKSFSRTKRVGVLLYPRFSNLCLANCIEPMRAANDLSGNPIYDWHVMSPQGGQVLSSSHLPVVGSDPALAPGFDLLMVLASYDFARHDTGQTRALLRQFARTTPVIAGFDSAPWMMGAAGLLDGKRATIHWDLTDTFATRFPRIQVERARVVKDGNRLTSAGALSALDLTLDMIRSDAGAALTLEVENLFLREGLPVGPENRPRAGDALVRRALGLMRDNMAAPLPLVELARRLSCQPRTLDRRCRAALGAPPGTVYRHLRLALARQLAEAGQTSVTDIAESCGYENASALTRAFRARYRRSPSEIARLNQF